MVAAYKVPLFEAAIAWRLLQIQSIILANLVIGENIVPELIQYRMTPARLAEALIPLLSDTPARRRQVEAFARLDNIMEIGRAAPSERAASIVLNCALGLNKPGREIVASDP
jgi:lipid-A-disaccharide synthase